VCCDDGALFIDPRMESNVDFGDVNDALLLLKIGVTTVLLELCCVNDGTAGSDDDVDDGTFDKNCFESPLLNVSIPFIRASFLVGLIPSVGDETAVMSLPFGVAIGFDLSLSPSLIVLESLVSGKQTECFFGPSNSSLVRGYSSSSLRLELLEESFSVGSLSLSIDDDIMGDACGENKDVIPLELILVIWSCVLSSLMTLVPLLPTAGNDGNGVRPVSSKGGNTGLGSSKLASRRFNSVINGGDGDFSADTRFGCEPIYGSQFHIYGDGDRRGNNH
jgi:hypothetical protein